MIMRQLMAGIADVGALADVQVSAITNDSRRVQAGCVFVCMKGVRSDGHDYAAAAVQAGAAAVVVEHDCGLPCQIIVPSTRAAWALMSANWFGHPASRMRLVGVTGTNGKTTTTFLLKSLLEGCGYKVGLIGTIQNMIGQQVLPSTHTTPDAYALQALFADMADAGCDVAVMEVSSHALDQERVEGCFFEVGVFTNLTQDHLDYHGTMENYLDAKKRLFVRSRAAVVNADDAWSARLCEGIACPITRYGLKTASEWHAEDIVQRPDGVDFVLCGPSVRRALHFPIPGKFSVYNALSCAACAAALGVSQEQIADALPASQGVKGRAEVVPTGRGFTVVIDYAHTPDGLENICSTMKACAGGRLVTLFGCGGDRDRTKRPKMGAIAARLSDFCIVTSDNPRTEAPDAIIAEILTGMQDTHTPYIVIENRVEAIRWAVQNAQPGDTVLLAGKGHETYQILADRTIHLDEREVVAEALQNV